MRWSLILFLAVVFAIACSSGTKQPAKAQVVGNQNGVCLAGNGNGNNIVGQPCAPTPTPAPAATPPPLRDQMSWIGENICCGVNTNNNSTAAQLTQYADLCNGFKSASGQYGNQCPGPGRWGYSNGWYYYVEGGMGQPNIHGHDVDIPFGSYNNAAGRTCNAAAKQASGNFWDQQTTVTLGGTSYTLPDYTSTGSNNWLLWANGGTVGNANYMISGWTGGVYYFYLNLNSASLLAYENDVIANCNYSTGYPDFDVGNPFQDNTYIGLQSGTWDKWDRYPTGKNIGSTACGTSPNCANPAYGESGTSFVPATFFGVSAASTTTTLRTTVITTNDTPINMASDTSWRSAQTNFLAGMTHRNGASDLIAYNGFLNTDQTANKVTNIRFPIGEEVLIGTFNCSGTACYPPALPYNGATPEQIHSTLNVDLGMKQALETCAALYQEVINPGTNTQISCMWLADQPNYLYNSTTTTALGTGQHQQNQMWQYAPIFALYNDTYPDMTSEWSNMCGFPSSSTTIAGTNCMDVWPLDFIMPSGRITPMPADPAGAAGAKPCGEYSGYDYEGTKVQCTVGGPYDVGVQCASTAGLYCFEFNHLWAYKITALSPCTTYSRANFATCAVDLGPFALVINGTGTAQTISTTHITSWLPHIGSQLGHVLVPCTPLAAYWGSGSGAAVYAMPQSGTLGYGTANICSGSTGMDVPSGGTWDNSKLLSGITTNNQVLYDGQVLYLTK